MDTSVVHDWQSKLLRLCVGYEPQNIFNMDEMGLFYRSLPDKSLAVCGTETHGGRHSKERVTVVLCCSMTGEVFKTLIIGKSRQSHCFQNVNVAALPVTWHYNKKAWMTSVLFTE